MRILQVNTTDTRGGAARVAASLHQAYQARGHDSWLIVGHKLGDDVDTLPLKHDLASGWWQRPLWQAENGIARHRFRGARWLRNALRMATNPRRIADWYRGYEDFYFPGTKHLLKLPESITDILHLHNLHGHYFDLRQLPHLTSQVPTVLSLHDAWLLSGHCAFSLGCERWRKGCGHCPDLGIQPAIHRDGTAENWQRKLAIYSSSRYHVITPSQWLMDKVIDSPLAAGLISSRIIPHGIDLDIFQPGSKTSARRFLSLSEFGKIILMVANGFRDNPWKDFGIARRVFSQLTTVDRKDPITVLAIGDSLPDERFGNVIIRFVPYIRDKALLARYYQAADLLLTTSRVEVWGLAISEALACGTPVVATAVGGIPEQVSSWPQEKSDKANGILIGPDDATGLVDALNHLLNDSSLLRELGLNARRRAQVELDFTTQVDRYLSYYLELTKDWKTSLVR